MFKNWRKQYFMFDVTQMFKNWRNPYVYAFA